MVKYLCLTQLWYMIIVSTMFQYNSSKTAGKVCHTKLPTFCTYRLTDRQMEGQADTSISNRTFRFFLRKRGRRVINILRNEIYCEMSILDNNHRRHLGNENTLLFLENDQAKMLFIFTFMSLF